MKYTGIIKGSKTLDFQMFSAAMLAAELKLDLIKVYLGDYYGEVAFAFLIINVFLRFATKHGLGKKMFGKKDV